MATLEVSLLGTPIVLLDRQPVAFESRKAIALLAFLAVTGEPRQRSEVATLLWPESDSKRARGALRYTFSILQRALGKEWFQSDRATIGLTGALANGPHCILDTAQFCSLLESGRDHMHAPDTACPDCVEQTTTAVKLYRDDFLTGFGLRDSVNFDEWQFFQVEGFRHQMSSALRQLTRYHTQQADHQQALVHVRQLLRLDPLQESVQREAMQLYVHAGQWEQALHQYDECKTLLQAELGVPPSPATIQLYEQIRERKLEASPSLASTEEAPDGSQSTITATPPNNLQSAHMPILGREGEIAALRQLLDDANCRMVTLLGPGGIGKTRLGLQIAIDLCSGTKNSFANGIYFVPLAAMETDELLITSIASALQLSFSGTKTPKEQLFQYLHKQQLLLVLDNFEQLAAAAPLLAEFLNAATGIKLLVTSRVRLNLHEEWLYEVNGLPLPQKERAAPDELAANDAVQLFYQRARQLDARFVLEDSLSSIVQICRILQGMPLGIELAAGWVRTFSCAQIASQIQQDLDFLATPSQNVPQRHRSLRAAFLHSWRGLEEEERTVFAKAALFRGGFDLDAAKAVIGASPITLGALVDKSMVQRIPQRPDGADRFAVHELLRQYAEEELESMGSEATHQKHCNYFSRFIETQLPHRSLASEDEALEKIETELENVRAAWIWLVDQIGTARTEVARQFLADQVGRFVPMMAHFYLRFSRFEEGQRFFLDAANAMKAAKWWTLSTGDFAQSCAFRLAQVEARLAEFAFNLSRFHEVAQTYERLIPYLHQAEEAGEIASAQTGLGKTFIRMGRYAEAEPLLQESLAIFRGVDDVVGTTAALNGLGILYSNQGLFEKARPYYEEFLTTARANQYQRGMANALNNLGSNYARAGEHEKALPLYQGCHRLSLITNERLVIAVSLSNLGSTSRVLGQYPEACDYYIESLTICREIGDRRWTAAGLNGLGLTRIDSGAWEEAVPHLLEALSTAQEIESFPDILDALAPLGEIILNQGDVKEAERILNFVATHKVTQTLARQRSQKLLAEIGSHCEADADVHNRTSDDTLEDMIVLATKQVATPSDHQTY